MFTNNDCQMNKSSVFFKIKEIICLFTLLFVFVLVGITSLTLPANAATNESNSSLVSLVPAASNPPLLNPTFEREKVHVGITPTGWSNGDDPTIDLTPPIPFQQILSEMALSNYEGSQTSGKYPENIEDLQRELKIRNLTISEPWVGTKFTEVGQEDETLKEFQKQMEFMQQIGGTSIVVAELGYAVHQKKCVDPLLNRPHFNNQQWSKMVKGLNTLGKLAKENGMQLMYHPHIGTGVETLTDIDRLMQDTNPEYVNLLLDTGHLYYAGVDPLEVAQKYSDRIKHVHLKNIRQSILQESIDTGRSFLDSIRAGIFTVPGDLAGAIDFQPILQTLATANYQGWLMVEAEQDPNQANPLQYALMARQYLEKVIGF
ncbi:myo-inosose-2 dehydratase [Nodularia sp. UHCC 0506]|uniref:myo-inosose-2 dehydratase n=1 Tax=Nodularia sp. UHCC 0506 TaxID=3110243 RepID=UPI002B1FFF81|nr:myo-inosose-2 dehydratase [Nodularia sp. UHCC 0506]MEA5515810.1 myo-inosose-2 dehydratase [Nodularia sp. UHCC 0506]